MSRPVEVGDHIRLPGDYVRDGRVVVVTSLTPSGLPRITDSHGESVVRRWRPATAADFDLQVRDLETREARWRLTKCIDEVGRTISGRDGHEAAAVNRIAGICMDYLRTVGRLPAIAPEAAALLQVMREHHRDAAADDPLDAAFDAWHRAGYPGTKGEP